MNRIFRQLALIALLIPTTVMAANDEIVTEDINARVSQKALDGLNGKEIECGSGSTGETTRTGIEVTFRCSFTVKDAAGGSRRHVYEVVTINPEGESFTNRVVALDNINLSFVVLKFSGLAHNDVDTTPVEVHGDTLGFRLSGRVEAIVRQQGMRRLR